MDKAIKDIQPRWSEQVWADLGGSGPVTMIDDWSRVNETGVEGDATVASADKGHLWAEATIEKLIRFMDDFRQHPIKPRRNFNYVPDAITEK
jgi:creatinine amidohydrolase/Fe(II)-dependent formamide hydrolase-like protein